MQQQKTGILLVAFGATTPLGNTALQLFENKVREVYPYIPIRWAFSSAIIRDRLAKDRVKSDSIIKALKRMYFEKFTHIAVQSLHIIPGVEYEQLHADCMEVVQENGITLSLGTPLLHSEEDIDKAASALIHHLPKEHDSKSAVICIGHGSWHNAATQYASLSKAVQQHDPHVFIGTLEGKATIERFLPKLQTLQIETVWLMPLLSVVGKHTQEDMAGSAPHSWKSQLKKAGFTTKAVLKGTAEYNHFIAIWLKHLLEAVQKIS